MFLGKPYGIGKGDALIRIRTSSPTCGAASETKLRFAPPEIVDVARVASRSARSTRSLRTGCHQLPLFLDGRRLRGCDFVQGPDRIARQDQLYPAVLLPSLGRVVGSDGFGLAEAVRLD